MIDHTLNSPWWLALGVGAGAGLVLTRAARNLAVRVGLVDTPDGWRKIHVRPVPAVGGVAVLLATVIAVVVAVGADPELAAMVSNDARRAGALLAAAVTITAVGFVDDRYNLRARHKLVGQVAAALILVLGGGYLIERISVFGMIVEFGPLAGLATVFWLLACVNALNLIDGMDGLLGTVAVTGLGTLAVIALLAGQVFAGVVALALCGAVVGFLWFNLPPATIYMGDAGSMLVGLVIGALAIPAFLKGPATVALICPVAILILPVLDTSAAIIRRKLTGRGLAIADRGHLHHVLLRHGLTVPRVLVLVAALGLVASAGALASTALHNDLYALVGAFGVVITLLSTRLFGHAEFHLVCKRVGLVLRVALGRGTPAGAELAIRLQGSIDWDQVWSELSGAAMDADLQSLALDVNAPSLHENYHAQWDRPVRAISDAHWWRVEIPLFTQGHLLGRLAITGWRDDRPIGDTLQRLARIVEATELRAAALTAVAWRPAGFTDASLPRSGDAGATCGHSKTGLVH